MMNKKNVTVGPRIVNRANWTEELIYSGFLDGDKVKALTPVDRIIHERNKELNCIRLLGTLLTADNLKEVKFKQCDQDSFILETDWVSVLLTDKLKERNIDLAILPELLAAFPEFYHTVNGASSENFLDLAMKSEFSFDQQFQFTVNKDRHYANVSNMMICDPKTGRILSGNYFDKAKNKMVDFPLDVMKEKYPQWEWDRESENNQRQMAAALLEVEHRLEDMNALGIVDIFPEIELDPIHQAIIVNNPNAIYGVEIAKHIDYPKINGEVIHPRHYYLDKKSGQVIWLSYKALSGKSNSAGKTLLKVVTETKDSIYNKLRAAMETNGVQIVEIDSYPYGSKISHGIPLAVTIGNHIQRFGSLEPKAEQFVDDRPETIRTNSRVKIVDNGKHKWPVAKPRKGHRR